MMIAETETIAPNHPADVTAYKNLTKLLGQYINATSILSHMDSFLNRLYDESIRIFHDSSIRGMDSITAKELESVKNTANIIDENMTYLNEWFNSEMTSLWNSEYIQNLVGGVFNYDMYLGIYNKLLKKYELFKENGFYMFQNEVNISKKLKSRVLDVNEGIIISDGKVLNYIN